MAPWTEIDAANIFLLQFFLPCAALVSRWNIKDWSAVVGRQCEHIIFITKKKLFDKLRAEFNLMAEPDEWKYALLLLWFQQIWKFSRISYINWNECERLSLSLSLAPSSVGISVRWMCVNVDDDDCRLKPHTAYMLNTHSVRENEENRRTFSNFDSCNLASSICPLFYVLPRRAYCVQYITIPIEVWRREPRWGALTI